MSGIVKLGLTIGIVLLMIPGLVIEPGPISEIVGLGAIMSIWGYEDILNGGGS